MSGAMTPTDSHTHDAGRRCPIPPDRQRHAVPDIANIQRVVAISSLRKVKRSPSSGPRSGQSEVVRALFVHSDVRPPLGSDVWVHTQIMRGLDRDAHEVHVACVSGPPADPTPVYEAVGSLDDVRVVEVSAGPRRSDVRSIRR